MNKKEKLWAKRVADWQGSGLSSEAFSKGREFTAGGLRYWAHQLRARAAKTAPVTRVRLARVRRRPAKSTARVATRAEGSSIPVVLEVGSIRIAVRRGFDRETLAGVLEVLGGPR